METNESLLIVGLALQLLVMVVLVMRTKRQATIGLDEVHQAVSEEVATLRDDISGRLDLSDARLAELESVSATLADRENEADLAERLAPLLRETADDLEERVKKALTEINLRVEKVTTEVVRRREEGETDALTRVLRDRGFTEVRMVDEPVSEDGRTKVLVEARRDGMVYKGPVFIDGDQVVEQRLSPSYPMFP